MLTLEETVKGGNPIHLTFEHPWQRLKKNGMDIYHNHETGEEKRSRPKELDDVVDRMHHEAKFPDKDFFPRKAAPADQVAAPKALPGARRAEHAWGQVRRARAKTLPAFTSGKRLSCER